MEEIYDNKALEKALNLITKRFKYFKVLIVSNLENEKTFENFILNVKASVKSCELITLPNCSTQTKVVKGLILDKLTEDVGLIINLSEIVVMNAIDDCFCKIKVMNVLNAPNFELLTYNCDYVVVDYQIIENCKNKLVASCYGELCASCFYVLEQVFNKAVFQNQIDSIAMIEIETLIKDLSMLPSGVLKGKLGKRILFNMCLKLKNLVDISSLKNGFVVNLAKQIVANSRYKNLQNGEAQMIASVLAFKSLNVLLKSQMLSKNIGANYYVRLNYIKQNSGDFALSKICKSFVCDKYLEEHINNFFKIQNSFLYVFETYFEIMNMMLKTFKKLYFDNGISLNKYMSEQVLIKSINCLPECYDDCSYATFIRDVGLLNKFVV